MIASRAPGQHAPRTGGGPRRSPRLLPSPAHVLGEVVAVTLDEGLQVIAALDDAAAVTSTAVAGVRNRGTGCNAA